MSRRLVCRSLLPVRVTVLVVCESMVASSNSSSELSCERDCRRQRNVRGRIRVAAIALVLCLSALTGGRGSAQETASRVTGRVVDGKSGKPVVGATVNASTPEATLSQRTGPTGEFLFTFAKPVRIRLWADKSGYLRAYAGQLGPADSNGQSATIQVPIGSSVAGVLLKLWLSVAIEGRIVNGTEAIAGATVQVLRREYRGDQFKWARVPLKSARSDDRGQYRIAGLPPGSYLVAVAERQPDSRTLTAPTFAPGSRRIAAASVFAVAGGVEVVAADVQLDSNEAVASLIGRVLDGDRGAATVTVTLRPQTLGGEIGTDLDEISSVTDDSGRFRFSGLLPGAYRLRVVQFPKGNALLLTLKGNFHGYAFGERIDGPEIAAGDPVPKLPSAPTLYDERDVTVSAQALEEVVLRLRPAATIGGKVVFQDGNQPDPNDLAKIPVLIRPADGSDLGGIPQARIESNGTFRSVGLPPGDYVITPLISRVRMSETWTTVALTSGGTDLLGGAVRLDSSDVTDVQVVLSTRPAEVSGTVRSRSAAQVALPTRVIMFPKSERLRGFYYAHPSLKRVTQINVSSLGEFRVTVPPGEYFVAAISNDLPEVWMTADYLAQLMPWATPIRLGIGDKVTVALEARPVMSGANR